MDTICRPSTLSTVAIVWSLLVYVAMVGREYATLDREDTRNQDRFASMCLFLVQGVALAYYATQWRTCHMWRGYGVYLVVTVLCHLLVLYTPRATAVCVRQ